MFRTDKLRKTVFLSLCVVFAVALNFIENFIPISSVVPGIKIGISNIVILAIIYIYSLKEGLMCAFLKSLILTVLSGNFSSFLYSVSGGIASSLGMGILKRFKMFSPLGVSMAGSFFNITAQIITAFFALGSYTVFYYYPYLIFFGTISGIINGYLVKLLLQKLERRV